MNADERRSGWGASVVLAACALMLALGLVARADAPSEDALIKLARDPAASQPARVEACWQLKILGTAKTAEGLAPLLADPAMSYPARVTLESLSDPAAGRVLVAALEAEKDARRQIGLINSLGLRRDDPAVPAITRQLTSADAAVRAAALYALGHIGTPAAAAALRDAKPDPATEGVRADALLRAAPSLPRADAQRVYQEFLSPDKPAAQRTAAFVALVAIDNDPIELLRTALAADDLPRYTGALSVIARGGGGTRTVAMASETIAKLPAARQVQLLAVLTARGDRAAIDAARAVLKSESPAVRAAAARMIGVWGHDADAPTLLDLAAAADDEAGLAAREALGTLPGTRADELLLAQFSSDDVAARARAIEVLANRAHRPLLDKLIDEKLYADPKLAVPAVAALRRLAGKTDFPRALALTLRLPPARRPALAAALPALAQRAGDSAAVAGEIQKALAAAKPEDRALLIGLFAGAQAPDAYKALDALLKDSDPETRKEAIRTLGKWDSAQPVERLLEVAKADADATARVLAIRAVLTIAQKPGSVPNPAAGVALVRRTLEAAERPEEKRAALAAVATFRGKEAIDYARSFKADPQLGPAALDALKKMKAE